MPDLIKIRKGNKDKIPVLQDGELGYSKDTNEFSFKQCKDINIKYDCIVKNILPANFESYCHIVTEKNGNTLSFNNFQDMTFSDTHEILIMHREGISVKYIKDINIQDIVLI